MSTPAESPDVYHLLFEQLPPVVRWALTILSLGLFGLAAWAWRRQERSIQRIETQMHERVDREIGELRKDLKEMNRLLVQIASNTGHRR